MKRQKILNAALELFVNEGFNGTSTALIAEKAQVANGTLFHYFKTKDKLIIDLYLEVKDNFLVSVTENYNPEDELKKKVFDLWHGIIRWATSSPKEFLYIQQFKNTPFFNLLTAEQKTRHDLFFHGIFSEGKEKNIFRDLDVDLLLMLNFTFLDGFIFYIFQHPEMLHDTNQVDLVLNSNWDSLSK
jgi:AcrR family transcriptional regulator